MPCTPSMVGWASSPRDRLTRSAGPGDDRRARRARTVGATQPGALPPPLAPPFADPRARSRPGTGRQGGAPARSGVCPDARQAAGREPSRLRESLPPPGRHRAASLARHDEAAAGCPAAAPRAGSARRQSRSSGRSPVAGSASVPAQWDSPDGWRSPLSDVLALGHRVGIDGGGRALAAVADVLALVPLGRSSSAVVFVSASVCRSPVSPAHSSPVQSSERRVSSVIADLPPAVMRRAASVPPPCAGPAPCARVAGRSPRDGCVSRSTLALARVRRRRRARGTRRGARSRRHPGRDGPPTARRGSSRGPCGRRAGSSRRHRRPPRRRRGRTDAAPRRGVGSQRLERRHERVEHRLVARDGLAELLDGVDRRGEGRLAQPVRIRVGGRRPRPPAAAPGRTARRSRPPTTPISRRPAAARSRPASSGASGALEVRGHGRRAPGRG